MRSEKEKMLNGELYDAGDKELTRERLHAQRLCRLYNHTSETEGRIRTELLQDLFGSTGDTIHIEPSFKCDYGYNIHVGKTFMQIMIV